MCGLFGAASTNLVSIEIDNVTTLGMLASFRGQDSTGILVGHEKKNKIKGFIEKQVGDPLDFFRDSRIINRMKSTRPVFVLGHARHATHGEINEHNAHPIQIHNIIGTHNGVIPNFSPKKEDEKTTSDSRLLFEHIQKHGLKKTVEQEMGYNASAACVWYDSNQQTLNFYRNSARPLWFMYDSSKTTLYWHSEKEALQFLNRGRSPCWEAVEMPQDTFFSFKAAQSVPRKLEFQELKRPVQTYTYVHSFTQNEYKSEIETVLTRAMYPRRVEPTQDEFVFIGPNKTMMSMPSAKTFFSRHSCDTCSFRCDPEKDDIVWWDGWNDMGYICKECWEDKENQLLIFRSADYPNTTPTAGQKVLKSLIGMHHEHGDES